MTPENIAAGDAQASAVTVTLPPGATHAAVAQGLGVVVTAPGCEVTAVQATLDGQGRSTWRVGSCDAGLHAIAATLVLQDLTQPLPGSASLNAFAPAQGTTTAVRPGNLLNLQIDAAAPFVGEVEVVSSDPTALLPVRFALNTAQTPAPVLVGRIALYTAGTQTVTARDAATGTTLVARTFVVGTAASQAAGGGDGTAGSGSGAGGTASHPVDAAQSTLTVGPTAVVANGTATALVSVTARDADGAPVAQAPVVVTVGGSGNLIVGGGGATAADGLALTSVASTVAETKAVTAQVGGTTLVASVAFLAGPPAAARSALTSVPAVVPADGSTASTARAVLRDAQGNPVPGAAIAWSATGAAVPAATSATTDAHGVAQTTLTAASQVAGSVAADVGAFTLLAPVTFWAPPAAGHSALSAAAPAATADGVTTLALTATARDAANVPLAGVPVTLSATGSNNVFTATAGGTAADGTFVAELASTTVESKTVTATFGGGAQASTTLNFVAGAPAAAQSQVVGAPASAVADGATAMAVTVTLADALGRGVAGVAVSLACSGTGNVLGASSGSTDAAGHFSTTLRSAHAEPKTLTATAAGLTLSGQVTFTAAPAAAARSSVVATPSLLPADGSHVSALSVTLRDAVGNVVIGAPVTVTASGTGTTVTAVGGSVTDASGQWRGQLVGSTAGGHLLTATSGALTLTAPVLLEAPTCAQQPRLGGVPWPSTGGGQLAAIAVADIDGDGHVDVAYTNTDTGPYAIPGSGAVLRGLGHGDFAAPMPFSTAIRAAGVRLVDLNGDGRLDLVSVGSYYTVTVGVAFGDGSGAFGSPTTFGDAYGHPDGAPASYEPATVDIDNNGALDVLVPVSNGNVVIWTNNGSGTLATAVSVNFGTSITAVAAADVNGDTIADLIATGSNGAYIALGSGSVAYGSATLVPSGGINANALRVADVDGDGHFDLLVSHAGASGSNNGIGVVLGHGDGTFAAASVYAAGYAPGDLQYIDVTHDGIVDLVSVDGNDGSVWQRAGVGGGSFGAASSFASDGRSGASVGGLALADLDGDGFRDMILARASLAHLAIVFGAAGGLAGPQLFDVGGSAVTGMVARDFTGDGVVDVLLGGQASNTFRLLRGIGAGNLATATLASSPRGPRNGMASADLDNDGTWDAVAGSGADNWAVVLLGDGAGGVATAVDETPNIWANVPALGDLNGDGVPDLVLTAANTNALAVLLGVGDGTFGTMQTTATSAAGAGLGLGDFDGDGHLDVAVASQGANAVEVLTGHHDGTFAAPAVHTVPSTPTGLTVADIDGDGRLDVAVACYGANAVSVLLGRGDGTLMPAQTVDAAISNPIAVVASDLNGDGHIDLAALDSVTTALQLHLLLGHGDGTFASPIIYGTAAMNMSTLAVADMDADGRPDVLLGGASLQVLLNRGCH